VIPTGADRPSGAPPTSAVRSSAARDAPSLPYSDGFFDRVVVSLVLCSVESVDEIARVLKGSGGEYRFFERGPEGWQAPFRRPDALLEAGRGRLPSRSERA
jgi:hypothetical protein